MLIDTGFGDGAVKGQLLGSMNSAGITPDEIGLILLTHLHRDHVGGLVDNGHAVFPDAGIMMSAAEHRSVAPEILRGMSPQARERIEPALDALSAYEGRIRDFVPGSILMEGITSIDLAGHTPGHAGFLISSGGAELLIAGDVVHVTGAQCAHPEICLSFDADKTRAVTIRRDTLSRAADGKTMIAGSHILFPGMGRAEREDDGFRFVPVR